MTLLSSAARALILPGLYTLVLPAAAAADGPRPYSVDLMLKSEGVGEVAFSPRGDRLLLEKLAAYDSSQNYDWSMYGRERAMLLDADLGSKARVKSLVSNEGERVWLTAYSPSGAKATVGWFDGTVAKAGIYDLRTGTLQKLVLPAPIGITDDYIPYWLSEKEFILFSQSAELQWKFSGAESYKHERMSHMARSSWRGVEAGVTVLGSGKHWKTEGESDWRFGALLRVDAHTGRATELGSGQFWQRSLSPDRRRFAALREIGNLDLSDVPVRGIVGIDKQLELVVYDFTRGGSTVIPCKSCNVTDKSLRWSPSGNKLFFSARVKRDGRIDHEYYIYDISRGALDRFAPKNVVLETAEDVLRHVYVTPFLWLTDDIPAVRTTTKPPAGTTGSPKQKDWHDWYALLPGRTPVALTAGLTGLG